ncbi:MAG TPA: NAD(P)H-binding protein [Actinophytocola sp.]|uniref:SDR family oxidoreductase n=1 Tax=Actinophytocola sp. TaxID=1872138 RepID=UPI002DBE21F2|nr:NAD(P)H-binding protein [Actinophytocola sp.]HEU5470376.1 NAD(P)H-binding protein [Actinophytocola sp.]
MTILVTGATGNVGRNVVHGLVRAGVRVRALTRNPAFPFPDDVEVVVGDLARPETVAPALAGVHALYLFPLAYLKPELSSFDDVITTEAIVGLAAAAGVRRVVMLGSSDPDFVHLERVVEGSGMAWTILRPGEFAVNKLNYWAPSIRAEGVVRTAYAEARGTPIHEADIADVAVAALLSDGHAGRHYELTGPQALTLREQVAAIAAGCGREIRLEQVSHERERAAMIDAGMPEVVVDEMILWYPANYAELMPPVSSAVREVTGHPGRTLAEWAADHAEEFR